MNRLAVALIGCAIVTAAARCSSEKEPHKSDVRIAVSQKPETIPGVPGEWLAFVGTVVNGSPSPITFEAHRLPGGFVGEGLLFECGEVEQWNAETQEWPPPDLRPMHSPLFSPNELYTLAPGASRVVCDRLFTRVDGATSARFRFRLWSTFRRDGQSWTSEEFVTKLRPVK
ncbi:MAG: hypothetical protein QM736_03965 [Vicinamibacterales bacterium]